MTDETSWTVAKSSTVTHIHCKDCGARMSTVDHMRGHGGEAGPWYCDECGLPWMVRWRDEELQIAPCPFRHRRTEKWALLVLPPQSEPVFLKVVKHIYEDEGGSTADERDRDVFFYESHQCPTNFLPDVRTVQVGHDTDPHGLFRFVRSWDMAPDADEHDNAPLNTSGWQEAVAGNVTF